MSRDPCLPTSHVSSRKLSPSRWRSGSTCCVPFLPPERAISTKVVTREGTLTMAATRARSLMKIESDLNVGMLIQHTQRPSALYVETLKRSLDLSCRFPRDAENTRGERSKSALGTYEGVPSPDKKRTPATGAGKSAL